MRPGLAGLCLLVLCAAAGAQAHNVLLIIADDLGVDLVNAYQESPDANHTPVIDSLATGGILFRNAWADPVCSPTRTTMLTGRHGFRTGMGRAVNSVSDLYEVQVSETTLPHILAPAWHSSAIGKWHMSAEQLSGVMHPMLLGFEHHVGSMSIFPGFISDDYYNYEKAVDDVLVQSTIYATTDTVNDCLAQIQDYGSDPWFIWLAFNAPHAPFHKPPANLHTFTLPTQISGNIPIHVRACVEAMDTEMGRLFSSMDPGVLANTVIIFIGDNGTDKFGATPPFAGNKAKGTVYEGGINVPLIIKGPGVAVGAQCEALVSSTDIFATVADIAGVTHDTGADSVSLAPYFAQPNRTPLRSKVYAEFYSPNGYATKDFCMRAVREQRYKYIWSFDTTTQPTPVQQLFDLQVDPFETVNLLPGPLTQPQQNALDELAAEMASLYIPWASVSDGLAGIDGVPTLTGTGTPVGGTPVTFTLEHANPLAPAWFLVGLTAIHAHFKGGILGPAPDIILPFTVAADGTIVFGANWPNALPPGLSIFYQYWIQDPAAVRGYSASNTEASLMAM